MSPVVQLTRRGARRGDPDTISRIRETFARQHLVRIPSFLAPDLLDNIVRLVDGAEFQRRIHPDMDDAVDVSLENSGVRWFLIFLMNDPHLFSAIQDLTGCDEIGFFYPVVYKIVPGQGHFDRWHDDAAGGNRMIGISINLGRELFEGGLLQIRHKGAEAVIHTEHNTGLGDAMLFRIGDHLEHFVTEVTGTVPRVALAGWFQRRPDYRQVASQLFSHLQISPATSLRART
jgi:hypothetical protein